MNDLQRLMERIMGHLLQAYLKQALDKNKASKFMSQKSMDLRFQNIAKYFQN